MVTHNGVGAVLCLGCSQPGVVRLGAPPALHLRQALLRAPLPPLQLQPMAQQRLESCSSEGSCSFS